MRMLRDSNQYNSHLIRVRIALIKKALIVTCLLAGACLMLPLRKAVHAQNRPQDKGAAHTRRNRNRDQRAIPSFSISTAPLNDASDSIVSKVQRGLDASPVKLHLDRQDISLVGLGSYTVNIQRGCNACHSAGPATEYNPGENPYCAQPKMTNPAVYLGGGRD